jgi:hypothetical protein
MKTSRSLGPFGVCVLTLALSTLITTASGAQIDILTNRYDDGRVGANLDETKLTPANVTVDLFGRLYAYPVDGAVYAQPLYVTGLTIQGIVRNVLYVATMNDKVYAFDAESASPSPLWVTDFTNPAAGITAVPMTDIVSPSLNIYGTAGIESTPVIDRVKRTLYLVARTKENGTYVQRLHALDITTGRDRPGSPATIGGSVPGAALDSVAGSDGRAITFNPRMVAGHVSDNVAGRDQKRCDNSAKGSVAAPSGSLFERFQVADDFRDLCVAQF